MSFVDRIAEIKRSLEQRKNVSPKNRLVSAYFYPGENHLAGFRAIDVPTKEIDEDDKMANTKPTSQ